MPRLPHDGHSTCAGNRIWQGLRTLHVENDRLSLSGARENVPGIDDEQIVAPYDGALRVHDADAVGVAVESDPEICLLAPHGRNEVAEVLDDGRIGMVIRKRPIALGVQEHRIHAEPREQAWRYERADAIAAIDHDLQSARQRADAPSNVVHVTLHHVLVPEPAGSGGECTALEQ